MEPDLFSRDPLPSVRAEADRLRENPLFARILDALPNIALILSGKRQVLYANEAAMGLAGLGSVDLLGLRPGDVVNCAFAGTSPAGCGTSVACRVCGALNAILEAQGTGKPARREFRVEQGREGERVSRDYLVTAAPILEEGEGVLLVSLQDVSDAKRREALERIFFHDVLNSITVLRSSAALLEEEFGKDEYVEYVVMAAEELHEEVLRQRDLRALERGELLVEASSASSLEILGEVSRAVARSVFAAGKELLVSPRSVDRSLITDPVLLRRVLVNMVKNAFEATGPGGQVSVETRPEADGVLFSVGNESFIPEDDQLQIFRRSFSTKGAGRGLGTYSMRLVTEGALGGRIGFESSPETGTRFWILLPEELPSWRAEAEGASPGRSNPPA